MRKPVMKVNQGLVWFFICSHAVGWIVATLQTLWIVHELEETFKTEIRKIK